MLPALKGKQIKDYVIGETLSQYNDMHLLEGTRKTGIQVTILMIEKKNMQQETFVSYNNLISENVNGIFPKYIQVVQSANNIYIIIEKISRLDYSKDSYQTVLPSIVLLYRNMAEYKLEESQVFLTAAGKLVYMPFYRKLQITSKFYAQFHNKSVLGEILTKLVPISNKNLILDIFVKNIDLPTAAQLISSAISAQLKPSNPMPASYPTMQQYDQQGDDEQIMQLMSKVKINPDMKKQAGQQFIRMSNRNDGGEEGKEINNLIENVQKSMLNQKPFKSSKTNKTKMDFKINQSKMNNNQFELYFQSYCESLRFLKKCIKQFLSYYKNGFTGVIASLLIATILTLRKAYLIKQLQQKNDIFELDIDMSTIPLQRYISYLKKDLKSEAKMIVNFKSIIQNCSMPVKTYTILVPFLQDDLSEIDFGKLHDFTFYFLSVLLKKSSENIHYLYVIDLMYIILHRHYEIVFFQNDFPRAWDRSYYETKFYLIQAVAPYWSINDKRQ